MDAVDARDGFDIQPLKKSMVSFDQKSIPVKSGKSEIDYGFNNKEMLYFRTLKDYYKKNPENIKIMLEIVADDKDSKISLRIIDWFVTRYAKKYRVKYDLQKNNEEYLFQDSFVVHLNYKAQLKSYTKKYFDPFKRKKKFEFTYGYGKKVMTTLGQLNFFRWAITCGIIDFVGNNYETIVKAMNSSNKENKKKKVAKKVKEVTKIIKVKGDNDIKILARKKIGEERTSIVLSFD